MKYLNKKLINSMDFYDTLCVRYMNYNEFIHAHENSKLFVENSFGHHEKDMFFADEVKRILSESDFKITLDKYKQLQHYANVCNQYFENAFDKVVASENQIKKNANKNIEKIAGYWKVHDGEIKSITVSEQNEVSIVIWHHSIYNMKFQNITSLNIEDISNCIGGDVLYTEIFEHTDDSYEYNFLIKKDMVGHKYEREYFEMGFVFRDIDIDIISIEYPEDYI